MASPHLSHKLEAGWMWMAKRCEGAELDITEFAIEGLVLENCNPSISSKYVNGVFNYLSNSSLFERVKDLFSSFDHISIINAKKCQSIFETLYANLRVVIRIFDYYKESLVAKYDNFVNDPKDCLILEIVQFEKTLYLFTKDFPSATLPLHKAHYRLGESMMLKKMQEVSHIGGLQHLLFYANVKNRKFKDADPHSTRQFLFYINLFRERNILERLASTAPEGSPHQAEHYETVFQRATSEFFFCQYLGSPKGLEGRIPIKRQPTSLFPAELKGINFDKMNKKNDEEEREVDTCFCPNLLFPKARSSRSAPLVNRVLRSCLEKVGLADQPVLDRLYEAAELSIFFFDIETLLRASSSEGLRENKLLNEQEMSKERFQTYCHGIQEPVCIGSLSPSPSIDICSEIWKSLSLESLGGSLDELALDRDLWSKLKTLDLSSKNKYLQKLKAIIKKHLSTSEELLRQCRVFHIDGNNPSYNGEICSTHREPSPTLIQDMVFRWLDHMFQQATVSKILKALLIEPLNEQIEIIAKTCGKNRGIFARIQQHLRTLINNHYVFG